MTSQAFHKKMLAAALVACFAAAAGAQVTAPAAGASRPDAAKMAEHFAKMKARMTQRLGELKTKLQITAGQEAAWTTWANAMVPAARSPAAHIDFSTLTTPQRIERMRTMRAERSGAMDKRADATMAFYSQLNAQQKQVFDAETAHLFDRMGRGGPGGHGGGHGHQGR